MEDRGTDGVEIFGVNLRTGTTDHEKAGRWTHGFARRRLIPKFGVPVTLDALLNVASNIAMQTDNDDAFKEVLQAFLDKYDSLKARFEARRDGGGHA